MEVFFGYMHVWVNYSGLVQIFPDWNLVVYWNMFESKLTITWCG